VYTKPTLVPQSNPYATETADEYFQMHDSQEKTKTGEWIAGVAEKILQRKGKMLEIGCGRGELLVGAANCGWDVYGIEMTNAFAQLARSTGISIECSSVEESKSLNDTYDVILLAAILEHLYDPVNILKRVHAALCPGGLVFIDVPNELSLTMRVGNWYMRLRGRDWTINLSPTFSPFHVVGFSPKALTRVLASVGFRVYSMNMPKWSNPAPRGNTVVEKFEHLALQVVGRIGEVIGMGDGINCWAIRE
jgi:2-polyprenyl-3-methyl-5-hydroxy-6-metoxy-1,4-benzoquinol methylase